MTHPLDGAYTRVKRAREHFESVQQEWMSMAEATKLITLSSRFDRDTSKIEVFIAAVPELNQQWALEISEMLFNLRCALDYLAWELANWNLRAKGEQRDPSNATQYPIAVSEARLNPAQVKDLDPKHAAVIKWLQPYSPIYNFQNVDVSNKRLGSRIPCTESCRHSFAFTKQH